VIVGLALPVEESSGAAGATSTTIGGVAQVLIAGPVVNTLEDRFTVTQLSLGGPSLAENY